ncbi:MAG TPA: hypothetical protein VGL81_12265 [Polyangiaceae bacterium]|jgi:hypothetical protein
MLRSICVKLVQAAALIACVGVGASGCWVHEGRDGRYGRYDHHDEHHEEHRDDRR